jgi:nitrate reductase assembly molybdenum cofactor insertion protein NarJ
MNKFLQTIIGQVFPSISMREANKQLKEKIKSTESQSNRAFMDNFNEIPIESFRQKYAEAFEVKNRFEDKQM